MDDRLPKKGESVEEIPEDVLKTFRRIRQARADGGMPGQTTITCDEAPGRRPKWRVV